jgi:hypothetical protein
MTMLIESFRLLLSERGCDEMKGGTVEDCGG